MGAVHHSRNSRVETCLFGLDAPYRLPVLCPPGLESLMKTLQYLSWCIRIHADGPSWVFILKGYFSFLFMNATAYFGMTKDTKDDPSSNNHFLILKPCNFYVLHLRNRTDFPDRLNERNILRWESSRWQQ